MEQLKMPRKIVGFHVDEKLDWVADLECGHCQHMRHDPPLIERSWVITHAGRQEHVGTELGCSECDTEC